MFLDDFLIRAALAGIGISLAAGPLGCFIIWRRMAFFGDATAHAAILGVAIALALSISVLVGALAVALIMAFLVSALDGRTFATDTLLGVLAHSALAFGLVAAAFLTGTRIDLMAFLVGDILAVGRGDLLVIWLGGALVVAALAWRWNALLTSTLSPDLAYAANINPRREQMVLTIALALVVAIALKIVGALMIAALMIIPAAAARTFATTPERMPVLAAVFGAVASLTGLAGSVQLDTPTGPTIVCAATIIFGASILLAASRRKNS